ncbi:hypothetical protein M9H77_31308 [Catharanthus roseus]|uniref:Uncharacterized protein n=1 Tax=Catharanthus roseus TaxID=4058 RepID=A0ACC0A3M6_CATRO|nr:hypothetical protein M9H77_31308 [Catharanthus roseus]
MFNIDWMEIARKRRCLIAESLAEKAGISPVTLSRIIHRKNDPDEQTQKLFRKERKEMDIRLSITSESNMSYLRLPLTKNEKDVHSSSNFKPLLTISPGCVLAIESGYFSLSLVELPGDAGEPWQLGFQDAATHMFGAVVGRTVTPAEAPPVPLVVIPKLAQPLLSDEVRRSILYRSDFQCSEILSYIGGLDSEQKQLIKKLVNFFMKEGKKKQEFVLFFVKLFVAQLERNAM